MRAETRRAVVHIGTHKTGSSSLQRWAAMNRSDIQATVGLRWYEGFFGTSHFELPLLCMRADRDFPMRRNRPGWNEGRLGQRIRDHVARQLALDDEAPIPALQGWRRDIFGEAALALKRGELALGADGKEIAVIDLSSSAVPEKAAVS